MIGRRTRRGCERTARDCRDWGVVLTRMPGSRVAPTSPWIGAWVDLSGRHPEHSIELDVDRDHTLTPLGWAGALRCFGEPRRIVVLDDETRTRVVAVVPPHIEVVVAEHAGLRELRRALQGAAHIEPRGRPRGAPN